MKKLIYLPLILLSMFVSLHSQEVQDFEDSDVIIKDTVHFKLNFKAGDEIVYRVESRDSIIFDFGDALLRDRYERFKITCDSVDSKGLFHLTCAFTDYIGIEAKGDIKDVKRNYSPWTNRKVYLVIDSVGNRRKALHSITNEASMSPGGAFQPFLLFPFVETEKTVNASWLVKSIDTLVENGFPSGILDHASLMRAEADMDTLDYHCSQFRFVRTATGEVNLQMEDQVVVTKAVINSGGRILISKDLLLPVFFFQSIEQKLRVYFSETDVKIGKHFINANYVLESHNRKK